MFQNIYRKISNNIGQVDFYIHFNYFGQNFQKHVFGQFSLYKHRFFARKTTMEQNCHKTTMEQNWKVCEPILESV